MTTDLATSICWEAAPKVLARACKPSRVTSTTTPSCRDTAVKGIVSQTILNSKGNG